MLDHRFKEFGRQGCAIGSGQRRAFDMLQTADRGGEDIRLKPVFVIDLADALEQAQPVFADIVQAADEGRHEGCSGFGGQQRLFAKVLRWLKIRHIRTRPYTPRTKGKAECFILTLLRDWAYATPYRSSDSQNLDLQRYLDWYNTARPHYAFAKQSPAKRFNDLLKNVLRNDRWQLSATGVDIWRRIF